MSSWTVDDTNGTLILPSLSFLFDKVWIVIFEWKFNRRIVFIVGNFSCIQRYVLILAFIKPGKCGAEQWKRFARAGWTFEKSIFFLQGKIGNIRLSIDKVQQRTYLLQRCNNWAHVVYLNIIGLVGKDDIDTVYLDLHLGGVTIFSRCDQDELCTRRDDSMLEKWQKWKRFCPLLRSAQCEKQRSLKARQNSCCCESCLKKMSFRKKVLPWLFRWLCVSLAYSTKHSFLKNRIKSIYVLVIGFVYVFR